YALALGKKPVVVNDCPGFLVNRVLFPYFQAFALLVRDGADIAEVDKVMESWGWPMGPAYLLDVVGLDTAVHAEKVMAEAFPDRMQRNFTSALEVLYEAGRLGQKNKQGFYDYSYDKKGRLQKTSSSDAQKLLADCCGEVRTFSKDEIIMRMMLPMITELVRCIEEGVVESVAEADMALVYGTGFPPFRGGVFRWIDSVGAKSICAAAETYHALGALYIAPALLQEKAQTAETFYC
ncbi:MAG TPA: 3-hydroxyacyl-CoA dehydrogenase family protein, partial [Cellvibrionaceae bacterium]